MKTLIVLLFFTSISSATDLDKMILPYSIVTSKSNIIVEGTINKLHADKYDLLVVDFIKGNESKTISVNKWDEWQCDTRQIKYEIGQKLILFLKKNDKGEYDIINGSTGELIINNDDSILRYEYQELPKKPIVKEGIKMLIKSISYTDNLYSNDKHKFEILVSQSEFEKFKTQNEFYFNATRGIQYAE